MDWLAAPLNASVPPPIDSVLPGDRSRLLLMYVYPDDPSARFPATVTPSSPPLLLRSDPLPLVIEPLAITPPDPSCVSPPVPNRPPGPTSMLPPPSASVPLRFRIPPVRL